MYKIYTSGAYFYIEKDNIINEGLAKDVFFRKKYTDSEQFAFTNVNGLEASNLIPFDEIVDINGDPYPSIEVFTEWLENNTGSDILLLKTMTTPPTPEFYNEAGQVKVNYTNLSLTNFVAGVTKVFNIAAATPNIEPSPTTKYPRSTPNNYSGFFDAIRGSNPIIDGYPSGRLIENPISGQPHLWRNQGSYSGKTPTNTGSLKITMRNPVSGFTASKSITLPSGLTTDTFSELFISIANDVSILSPNGYILEVVTSFTDVNLTVNITSITRTSLAIDKELD